MTHRDPHARAMAAPAVLARRIEIREATESDNAGLLALTRATPMGGTIALRIDRDPDFFALLRMRGDHVVYVAVRGGDVIGCISAALRTVYIAGAPETAAYVGDMKVHPNFSGSRISLRLIQALEAYLRSVGVDLCFSVVADGNRRAMPLFEGRLGIPRWISLGRFVVEGLAPSPWNRRSGRYTVERAQIADLPAIAKLLDVYHRARQFAPRLADEEIASLLPTRSGELIPQTLVARSGSNVVATLTLADVAEAKRNVLLGAPMLLRGALALLRLAAAPFPSFRIPRIGDSLKVLNVRHAACGEGHMAALHSLLKLARAETFRHRFTFLSLGLHERDPLRSLVMGMPRFTFSSLALATSLGGEGRLESLAEGIPFEDFALV